jgi:hypothetical protein
MMGKNEKQDIDAGGKDPVSDLEWAVPEYRPLPLDVNE